MAWTQTYHTNPLPRRYSLRGLATALTVSFVIFVVLDAGGAAVYLWRSALYSKMSDGEFVSEGTLFVADALDISYTIVWLLLLLPTAVLFIIWQFRHARNSRKLGVHGGLGKPGWAIGGWFIPVANYILPARQIYRSSRLPGAAPSPEVTAAIVLWAVAFGLSNVLESVAIGVQSAAESADDDLVRLAAPELIRAGGLLAEIVAAALALVVIRMLTKRQNAAFDASITEEIPASHGVTGMTDPYRPRDDWTRRAGRPDGDWARSAARESGNLAATGDQTPDAWAEVYGRRPPPDWPTRRWSLRGLAQTLSILIPLVAINEASYALDYFIRAPAVLGQGGFPFGFNFGFFYPLADGAQHIASLLAVTATSGLFIAWQFLHAKNARLLGQAHGLGPGWAIGGWFIPIANLVLPVVQLAQSSGASDPPPNRYRGESRTALIVWWAVVFYLSLLEISAVSSDPDTAEAADTLSGLLAMLSIPAAILAVAMIRQLTKRQEAALDAQAS